MYDKVGKETHFTLITNFLITAHTQVSCYLVLPCVLHTSSSLQVCVHQGRWWQVHQYQQQVKYMLSSKFKANRKQ